METDRTLLTGEAIAGALTLRTGKTWSLDHDPNTQQLTLVSTAGVRLSLAWDWRRRERIQVAGIYPKTTFYNREWPRISVREDRGADVIAGEIQRRLLPAHLELLAAVHAHNAREAGYQAQRASVANMVQSRVGGTVHEDEHGSQTIVRYRATEGPGFGEFKIRRQGESADVELRAVPIPVVWRIAEAVAEGDTPDVSL